jgi:hypothetical protein
MVVVVVVGCGVVGVAFGHVERVAFMVVVVEVR